jgi:KTSC domain
MSQPTSSTFHKVDFPGSSSLASVAYNVERRILQIEFRDRSTYHYLDVPEQIHRDLLLAESKGAYFNAKVRSRFPSLRWNSAPFA